MPKKSAKAGKSKNTYFNVYELVATFAGREGRLVQHVEEKDRLRLLECLAEREGHGFYELGGPRGHECVIHTHSRHPRSHERGSVEAGRG